MTGHPAWVFGAAFSPDGKTLASGGDDGVVRIQNIESYLQTLQQRETVRLIYFLPINRTAQQDIDAKLDTLIRDVQRFYAEQMDTHGFARKTFSNEPTKITMHTPLALPSNTIRLRFEVTDADGLHQAQLMIPTLRGDLADGIKLHGCQALNTETAWIEFTTTEFTADLTAAVELHVIDINGFLAQETFPIIRNDIVRVDVNNDGIVDVEDLVIVASKFGSSAIRGAFPNPDVNNDGVVNREDLLLVVEALESQENTTAAPSLTARREW